MKLLLFASGPALSQGAVDVWEPRGSVTSGRDPAQKRGAPPPGPQPGVLVQGAGSVFWGKDLVQADREEATPRRPIPVALIPSDSFLPSSLLSFFSFT